MHAWVCMSVCVCVCVWVCVYECVCVCVNVPGKGKVEHSTDCNCLCFGRVCGFYYCHSAQAVNQRTSHSWSRQTFVLNFTVLYYIWQLFKLFFWKKMFTKQRTFHPFLTVLNARVWKLRYKQWRREATSNHTIHLNMPTHTHTHHFLGNWGKKELPTYKMYSCNFYRQNMQYIYWFNHLQCINNHTTHIIKILEYTMVTHCHLQRQIMNEKGVTQHATRGRQNVSVFTIKCRSRAE